MNGWSARLDRGITRALDYAPWVIGALAGVLLLLIGLRLSGWPVESEPTLRVTETRGRLSGLITDGGTRILIINSPDREMARASLGSFLRPWHARPHLLIAPADDGAGIGLWEMLQLTEPRTVLVAGVPGADPIWSAIENECRERGIELRYVSSETQVTTSRLVLTVAANGPDERPEAAVVIRRDDTAIVFALSAATPDQRGQVLLFNGTPANVQSELLVTSNGEPREIEQSEVVIGYRETIDILIEPERIRVFGGTLRMPGGSAETP